MNWPDLLASLVGKNDLTPAQVNWAMEEILQGIASPAQIAGFLVGLRSKPETAPEITALVESLYKYAQPLAIDNKCLDIVGTGGDRSNSVNISTMAAILAATAGAKVVKHGNRSASSMAGSADVLELAGVVLGLDPSQVAEVAASEPITFCFAPTFHPALRHVAGVRKELGIATVFNFLGPLLNPAKPQSQAIGCADLAMARLMAAVFAARGVDAWVFRGDDGLDEITTTTTTTVLQVHNGQISESQINPLDFGISAAKPGDLLGQDAVYNLAVMHKVLAGESSPVADAVALNAAAGLAVYFHPALTPAAALEITLPLAKQVLASGQGLATLENWVARCQEIVNH